MDAARPRAAAHHDIPTDKPAPVKAETPKPAIIKRRPKFVADAVALLAAGTSEGRISLAQLGQYLKRTDPGFSPAIYGHSGLLDMVKTYDLLALKKEEGGHYTVGMSQAMEALADGGRG